jgi:hypothetical protein
MALPEHVLQKVLPRIFTDMETLGWDGLTDEEKTRQYNAWAEDADVGGVLSQFNDDPRHWIKDGPVKEWHRALAGVGPYAKYLPVQGGQVEQVVRLALGEDWGADISSIEIKPLRVTAHQREDHHDPVVVTWAPARDFKHLVWAAIKGNVDGDPREWILVVRGTFEKPTPADLRKFHERVGVRCGLRVEHIQVG